MRLPVSWLKDFVDLTLPIEELANLLTFGGLEVEEIEYVGWEMPREQVWPRSGISWDREKIVGRIRHSTPSRTRTVVLCDLSMASRSTWC
jgi:phenylalanyl-tRNA synthetase beta chain